MLSHDVGHKQALVHGGNNVARLIVCFTAYPQLICIVFDSEEARIEKLRDCGQSCVVTCDPADDVQYKHPSPRKRRRAARQSRNRLLTVIANRKQSRKQSRFKKRT